MKFIKTQNYKTIKKIMKFDERRMERTEFNSNDERIERYQKLASALNDFYSKERDDEYFSEFKVGFIKGDDSARPDSSAGEDSLCVYVEHNSPSPSFDNKLIIAFMGIEIQSRKDKNSWDIGWIDPEKSEYVTYN